MRYPNNIFNIARTRNIKLPKELIRAALHTRAFNIAYKQLVSVSKFRQAYYAKETTDEIRNMILTSVFKPNIDYSVRIGEAIKQPSKIEIHVGNLMSGSPYFYLMNRDKTYVPGSKLELSILRDAQIDYPFSKFITTISKLTTPQQMSAALRSTAWISGYMGLVSDFAFLVRAYVRHNDISTLLWAYMPDEEETLYYLDELNDDSSVLYDASALGDRLQMVLNDLRKFDGFMEGLGDAIVTHNTLKEQLFKLISLSKNKESLFSTDKSLINSYRNSQWESGLINKGELPDRSVYNFIFSALSVVDTSMDAVDSLLSLKIDDPDVMDKLMRIHGNKNPPTIETDTLFREPMKTHTGSYEFMKEKHLWEKTISKNKK